MPRYASGNTSLSICKRCGEEWPYGDMNTEADTKEWVCPDCLDDPDPYRRRRTLIDAQALAPLTQSPDQPITYATNFLSTNTTLSTSNALQYNCSAAITLTLPTIASVQALGLLYPWQVGIDTQGFVPVTLLCQGSDLILNQGSVQLTSNDNFSLYLAGAQYRVE